MTATERLALSLLTKRNLSGTAPSSILKMQRKLSIIQITILVLFQFSFFANRWSTRFFSSLPVAVLLLCWFTK
jgi:hypothetical protein